MKVSETTVLRLLCMIIVGITSCGIIKGRELADSLRIHHLPDVEVKATARPSTTRSITPTQTLERKDLEKLNVLQVSDAVKFFSGAQVKDYGGLGGLKTVSIRSLGANYTGIEYDGAMIANYQTGQSDIGRFSTENIDRITLQIGESDDINQTARMQSYAGALNVIRRKPLEGTDKQSRISLTTKGGMWQFFNQYISYEQALSQNFAAQVSGEWMQTEGNYPYTSGSGEKKKRENSDVKRANLEANLFGEFANSGKLSVKVYGYQTNQSLPGPDIYYTTSPGEALKEQNIFAQAGYEQQLSSKLTLKASAKFDDSQSDYTHYSAMYTSGKRESTYKQQEAYLGTVFAFRFTGNWSASWANDGMLGKFNSSFRDNQPERNTWLSALSLKYHRPQFTARASLHSYQSSDRVNQGMAFNNLHKLSPYAGISAQIIRQLPLRFRAFYKQTFRQPTFGDLYLATVPTADLRPETTRQYNIGASWVNSPAAWMPYWSITADVYRNHTDDKIIAHPKAQMYIWSVQNLGQVKAQGIDLKTDMRLQINSQLIWQCGASYTWQQVLDKTDVLTDTYNQQIAYTPNHSASGHMALILPWLDVSYTVLYCGVRYYERVNRPQYRMPAYSDQSISLSKAFTMQGMNIRLSAECLNVLDARYEVVRSYPMPGRSYRMSIMFNY